MPHQFVAGSLPPGVSPTMKLTARADLRPTIGNDPPEYIFVISHKNMPPNGLVSLTASVDSVAMTVASSSVIGLVDRPATNLQFSITGRPITNVDLKQGAPAAAVASVHT